MANSATDNNTTDDGVKKEPAEAFEEHLPLDKNQINEIQAAASINTQAFLQENKDNEADPVMESGPPTN